MTLPASHEVHDSPPFSLPSEGQTNVQCPFVEDGSDKRCKVVLDSQDVTAVVDDNEILNKFDRFKAAKAEPNTRTCPECGHFQTGDVEHPAMTCEACGFQYCFSHSNAHPPTETCEAYEARMKEKDAGSQALVDRTSKPCPKCKALTYKFTGCNHMKCPQCSQDW